MDRFLAEFAPEPKELGPILGPGPRLLDNILAERKQSGSNLGSAIWHQSGFRPNLGSWEEKAPIWQVPIWQKKCHYLGRPIWQFRTKKPIWKKGQSGNMKPLPHKYIKFTFSVSNLWQRPIWQAKPIWK